MRALFLAIPLIAAVLPIASVHAEDAKRPLVVVELFTSQGCNSCPPADAYLGELATRPDVLALAFHVDYWNYIGWSDPFASKQATQRQRDYAKSLSLRYVYTPQMVINGAMEGVGSERDAIGSLIKAAASDSSPHTAVTVARGTAGEVTVQIGAGAAPEPATVWLVGFDREHSTPVLRGENEGRTLKEYQIVRSFKSIGTWRGAPLNLSAASDAVSGDGVAVLVQLSGSGRIVGAASLKLPTS